MKKLLLTILALIGPFAAMLALAQNPSAVPTATPVQLQQGYYSVISITSTNAVNIQTTLTIPAPAPTLYNYICYLAFNASNNATSSANTVQVTTSTNFQAFALKYSLSATANNTYDWSAAFGTPSNGGCVKSTSPGTATTFVSPAAIAQTAFSWYASYFQAP